MVSIPPVQATYPLRTDGSGGPFAIQIEVVRPLYAAAAAHGIGPIGAVVIRNTGGAPERDLTAELTCRPALLSPLKLALDTIPPGTDISIREPRLPPDLARLREIIEADTATFTVQLLRDGAPVASAAAPLPVLAYNEWDARDPRLLAAFVMPNHPAISELVAEARTLQEREFGRAALEGYQSHDVERVKEQTAAVYGALQRIGITYLGVPASFEAGGQKLRSPDALRTAKQGNCFEVATWFAAGLEACGLQPVIVLLHGHAFGGLWLTDEPRSLDPIETDAATVRKLQQTGRLLLVETTAATSRPPIPFAQACRGRPDRGRDVPRAARRPRASGVRHQTAQRQRRRRLRLHGFPRRDAGPFPPRQSADSDSRATLQQDAPPVRRLDRRADRPLAAQRPDRRDDDRGSGRLRRPAPPERAPARRARHRRVRERPRGRADVSSRHDVAPPSRPIRPPRAGSLRGAARRMPAAARDRRRSRRRRAAGEAAQSVEEAPSAARGEGNILAARRARLPPMVRVGVLVSAALCAPAARPRAPRTRLPRRRVHALHGGRRHRPERGPGAEAEARVRSGRVRARRGAARGRLRNRRRCGVRPDHTGRDAAPPLRSAANHDPRVLRVSKAAHGARPEGDARFGRSGPQRVRRLDGPRARTGLHVPVRRRHLGLAVPGAPATGRSDPPGRSSTRRRRGLEPARGRPGGDGRAFVRPPGTARNREIADDHEHHRHPPGSGKASAVRGGEARRAVGRRQASRRRRAGLGVPRTPRGKGGSGGRGEKPGRSARGDTARGRGYV